MGKTVTVTLLYYRSELIGVFADQVLAREVVESYRGGISPIPNYDEFLILEKPIIGRSSNG